MSFLFGGGRPQPSSAEKLARAEIEVEMVSDLFNRFRSSPLFYIFVTNVFLASLNHAPKSVYLQITVKQTSTKGSRCALIDVFPSSSKSTSRLVRRCRPKRSTKALRLDPSVSACNVVDYCGRDHNSAAVKPFLPADGLNLTWPSLYVLGRQPGLQAFQDRSLFAGNTATRGIS